jgi:probable HAF family extracellular repeat protein
MASTTRVRSSAQGYLLSGGSYTALNVPTSPLPNPATVATDINSSGQIVGYYDFEINRKSFLYSNGTYTGVPGPYSGGNGGPWAEGINDAGQIVGYDSRFILVPHTSYGKVIGFVYANGAFTIIDDPLAVTPGGISFNPLGTFAKGINNAGQVVGYYNASGGAIHGFLYSGGSYTTLDDPLGAGGTYATGINNAGQIVGYFKDVNGGIHGFLYSGGAYTTIDDPLASGGTYVYDINDAGRIVGITSTAVGTGTDFSASCRRRQHLPARRPT